MGGENWKCNLDGSRRQNESRGIKRMAMDIGRRCYGRGTKEEPAEGEGRGERTDLFPHRESNALQALGPIIT